MKENKSSNTIARIENTLIFDSQYQLTAKEQKVILLLISKIDPVRQIALEEQFVSFKELKKVLLDKRSGSFTKELNRFTKRILDKKLTFKSDVLVNGEAVIGGISWFQSILPKVMDGVKGMEFMFAKRLEPLLIELKEYAQIDYVEVLPLNSGAAVRLFQIFKAHRNKMAKHQKRSKLKFELKELKRLLGIAGKYADYRNFRKRILEPMQEEINAHTTIRMKYTPIKTGYSVTAIEFEFWDKGSRTKKHNKLSVEVLTYAQLKAYELLVDYGINEGIALELLTKCGGSELKGFEDWYFETVIEIFETKTEQTDSSAKAGTLVNWFLKKKVFEQGDHFAKIMERLQARKKQLQKERSDAWGNRLLAKDMTWQEFEDRFNKE